MAPQSYIAARPHPAMRARARARGRARSAPDGDAHVSAEPHVDIRLLQDAAEGRAVRALPWQALQLQSQAACLAAGRVARAGRRGGRRGRAAEGRQRPGDTRSAAFRGPEGGSPRPRWGGKAHRHPADSGTQLVPGAEPSAGPPWRPRPAATAPARHTATRWPSAGSRGTHRERARATAAGPGSSAAGAAVAAAAAAGSFGSSCGCSGCCSSQGRCIDAGPAALGSRIPPPKSGMAARSASGWPARHTMDSLAREPWASPKASELAGGSG